MELKLTSAQHELRNELKVRGAASRHSIAWRCTDQNRRFIK